MSLCYVAGQSWDLPSAHAVRFHIYLNILLYTCQTWYERRLIPASHRSHDHHLCKRQKWLTARPQKWFYLLFHLQDSCMSNKTKIMVSLDVSVEYRLFPRKSIADYFPPAKLSVCCLVGSLTGKWGLKGYKRITHSLQWIQTRDMLSVC